jgi:uncharacterized membrane protein YhaH (DUF805 family)/uncharacterized membrane protein YphA (DoxX/SURF4 family)
MKYAVWFFRLLFASWMIPAGLEHFIPIFPQPLGSQELSMALFEGLRDSHLFDLVKFVELIAGLGVLFGYHTPLALVVCLPVSFNVFYWDAPLEGWGSGAARFGYGTLLTNAVLCLAYFRSYQPMCSLKHQVADERQSLVQKGRLVFGAVILAFAARILFFGPDPGGETPLAAQLMTALVNSNLLYVALTLQLVAGALILSGFFVPLALCIQMPLSTCALYWALILNQAPMLAILTLVVFALNGLLMLAYLPYYRGVLQRRALAAGEDATSGLNFDSLFVNPNGRTSREHYMPAMLVVVLVLLFYNYVIGGGGRNAQFCMLTLMYPLFVVLVRRVRDTGLETRWLFIPLTITLYFWDVHLGYFSFGALVDGIIGWMALVTTGAFIVWGFVNSGRESPAVQT